MLLSEIANRIMGIGNTHLSRCKRFHPKCSLIVLLFASIVASNLGSALADVSSKITCEDEHMLVELIGTTPIAGAYLDGLRDYPDASCRATRVGESHLQFRLSLKDFYRCSTTLILNRITGIRTFYNRIVVLQPNQESPELSQILLLAKCSVGGDVGDFEHNHLNSSHWREKRDVLPAGFQEPDNVAIFGEREGRAPEPMLSMLVRQDGRVIGQELLVQPGAPLTMEVNLDQKSKDIYGILVAHLDVTDTGTQSEVIILNGCTVDPYLFENFLTDDGDLLEAKFRAFKFPDTNYVLFRGTVNVCLGSCQGVECSNRQLGYGRRRRRAVDMSHKGGHPKNRVYEVQMTTILKIADLEGSKEGRERAILGANLPGNDAKQTRELPGIADLQLVAESSTPSKAISSLLATTISTLFLALLIH